MTIRHYENEPRLFGYLGMPIHGATLSDLETSAVEALQSHKTTYYTPADAHLAWHALTKEEIRRLLFDIDRLFCDTKGLWNLANYAGALVPDVIPKELLYSKILQHCASNNIPVSFFGSHKLTHTQLRKSLLSTYPELKIAQCIPKPKGPVFDWDQDSIIQSLKSAKTGALFLALGPGTEQQWVQINKSNLEIPLILSCNKSAFTCLTSSKSFYKKLLESLSPNFIGRYFTLLRETIKWRFSQEQKSDGQAVVLKGAREVYLSHLYERIEWSGSVDVTHIDSLQVPINFRKNIVCECGKVNFIDSSGIGLLIQIARNCKQEGRFLCLMRPSDAVLRAIRAMRLEKQLKIVWSTRELEEELKSHEDCLVCITPADNGKDYEIKPLLDLKPRTIERIEKEIDRLLPKLEKGAQITINLQYIFFMDSFGIGAIVNVKKELAKHDVPLKLNRVNSGPMKTLKMLKLDDVLIEAATLDLIA